MSSEVDVKRLVDAARNLVKRSTDRMIRGSLEWDLAQSLAPFAAERGLDRLASTTDADPVQAFRDTCMGQPAPSPSVPTPEQERTPYHVACDVVSVAENAETWGEAYKPIAAIITADRAAVAATLRAEVERLTRENEKQRADLVTHYQGAIDTHYKPRIAALEAKLAAGGGDGKRETIVLDQKPMYNEVFGAAVHLECAYIQKHGILPMPPNWSVDRARALHAALTAKGAERG